MVKVSKSLEVDYYEPLSFHQILVLLIKERLKVEFTREPVDVFLLAKMFVCSRVSRVDLYLE